VFREEAGDIIQIYEVDEEGAFVYEDIATVDAGVFQFDFEDVGLALRAVMSDGLGNGNRRKDRAADWSRTFSFS